MKKRMILILAGMMLLISVRAEEQVQKKTTKDGQQVYQFNFYQKEENDTREKLSIKSLEAEKREKNRGLEVFGMMRSTNSDRERNFIESMNTFGVGFIRRDSEDRSKQFSFGFVYSTVKSELEIYDGSFFGDEFKAELSGFSFGGYGKYSHFFDYKIVGLTLSTILDLQYGELKNSGAIPEEFKLVNVCGTAEAVLSLKFTDSRIGVGGNLGYCRFIADGSVISEAYDDRYSSVVTGVSLIFNFGV